MPRIYQPDKSKGDCPMIVNLNWIVAFLGCVALFLFWLWKRASGARGFLFMLIGLSVIIGAVIYQQDASQLPGMIGFLLAFLVLALLLLCLGKLSFAHRHHAPRYQAPHEMRGRCSECAKLAQVKHYERGWLCATCANRRDAKAA
jgi:heme A synthase